MDIAEKLERLKSELPENVRILAVSKFHPESVIMEAYRAGQRIFGENRVQELLPKYEHLPKDIEWHFIGHLQVNKVKYIAPFIHAIQSIDSLKIAETVNKEANKCNRKIRVFLQIHIAQEEQKFGFSYDEAADLLKSGVLGSMTNLDIAGLMGMATLTDNSTQIRNEFHRLRCFFQQLKNDYFADNDSFCELSCGMSDDYPIAVNEGSTMIRIGSKLFGPR
ncbi:MAG: YggS family pyridoxal phosphate-dependent enzyme [Candidatus Azobacteroides sp.]|nr:YggS family pyridoxal phosphate-dependent enzyme [Candidatus Azobacteroides sp.]